MEDFKKKKKREVNLKQSNLDQLECLLGCDITCVIDDSFGRKQTKGSDVLMISGDENLASDWLTTLLSPFFLRFILPADFCTGHTHTHTEDACSSHTHRMMSRQKKKKKKKKSSDGCPDVLEQGTWRKHCHCSRSDLSFCLKVSVTPAFKTVKSWGRISNVLNLNMWVQPITSRLNGADLWGSGELGSLKWRKTT